MLIPDHAPREVLAGELPALEVERVPIAVIGRTPEDGHAAIVFEPAQLAIVRDVTPDQIAPLAAPGGPLGPERPGPEPLDRRVPLSIAVEQRVDGDDVGIDVRHRGRVRTEVPRWSRNRARRVR